jgi:hypothetical protein
LLHVRDSLPNLILPGFVIGIPFPSRPIEDKKSFAGNRIGKPPFREFPGIITNGAFHSSQSLEDLELRLVLEEFRVSIEDTVYPNLTERTKHIPRHGHP